MSKLTWKEILNAHTDKRSEMKAPALVAVILTLHISVIGAFVFIQGCGTSRPAKPVMVEPPPAPNLPTHRPAARTTPPPVFRPPVTPASTVSAEGKTYVVKKGESLSRIASKVGISARDLAAINGIDNPNKIRIGQKLILPPHANVSSVGSAPAPAPAKPAVSTPVKPMVTGGTYTIQKGDSLSKIARKYGVSAKQLSAANNITDPNKIRIGQKLNVPSRSSTGSSSAPVIQSSPVVAPVPSARVAPAPLAPAIPAAPTALAIEAAPIVTSIPTYEVTVREGQTLQSIARDNVVTVDELREANNLLPNEEVRPGQKVAIPLPN